MGLYLLSGYYEIKLLMFEYMQSYRLELALEEIRRKTEVKVVPATLETIFTDRDLEFMPSV